MENDAADETETESIPAMEEAIEDVPDADEAPELESSETEQEQADKEDGA